MSHPQNRSLSVALARLRFAVITSCWIIALSLATQVVVWSLATFTDLRYGDPEVPENTELIVEGAKKPARPPAPGGRWKKKGTEEPVDDGPTLSIHDRTFMTAVNVARPLGLMSALVMWPLIALAVVLAVPAGAPNLERAVTALVASIVLVLLALPLGGWFGLGWGEGTFSSYERMTAEVEAARDEGFSPAFYAQFLLLPGVSAVGFIMIGFRFSSAVEAVLLKEIAGVDPELEAEASNVKASSLVGTGRTAGALSKALEADKAKKKSVKAKKGGRMSQVSPGEMPKRLI
ncbi:MAG: hypothetical protein ACYS0G_10635 [Planctomycetota bacterium]|jgi:hypothetical protein